MLPFPIFASGVWFTTVRMSSGLAVLKSIPKEPIPNIVKWSFITGVSVLQMGTLCRFAIPESWFGLNKIGVRIEIWREVDKSATGVF